MMTTNFKIKTYRSEQYKTYIRSLGCLVYHCQKPSEPHHEESGGVGMKGSDLSCVPLCGGLQGHHRERHDTGRYTFWEKHNIDVDAEYIRLLKGYIMEREG